jgi:hypothetical protein
MRKRLMAVVLAVTGALIPGLALAYSVQANQNVTVPKGETKTGTFYATGQTITIDGDINGDLICAGSTVNVNGAVHGDVICAGQLVSVNGPVDGSVRLAGQSVSVNNTVGRNKTQRQAMSTTAGFAFRLYWIIATLVTALVLTWLVPRLFGRASRVLLERPWQSLGWGVLISIFGPFAFLLLLLSIIGIPLALLWLLTWLFVMGLGSMVAGVAVGRWLLHRADWHQDSLPLAALFGVPLVVILCSIPGVGGLVALVALSWAAGGLAQAAVASRA